MTKEVLDNGTTPEHDACPPKKRPKEINEANLAISLRIVAFIGCTTAFGFSCAMFGLVAGSRVMKRHKSNPQQYNRSSHNLGLAGIILSILSMISFVILLFTYRIVY